MVKHIRTPPKAVLLVRPNTCRGGARGQWSWCPAANWARPPGGSVCRRGLLCIFRSFVVHHHHGKMGWAACLVCWWQCVNVMWCVAMQSEACKTYQAHKSRWCREMSFRTFLLTMIRHHYWSRILSQWCFTHNHELCHCWQVFAAYIVILLLRQIATLVGPEEHLLLVRWLNLIWTLQINQELGVRLDILLDRFIIQHHLILTRTAELRVQTAQKLI